MTYACGKQFVKYMDSFLPVLEMGLQHHQVGGRLAQLCISHPHGPAAIEWEQLLLHLPFNSSCCPLQLNGLAACFILRCVPFKH